MIDALHLVDTHWYRLTDNGLILEEKPGVPEHGLALRPPAVGETQWLTGAEIRAQQLNVWRAE